LEKDPGPVAGVGLGTPRPSVLQPAQRRESLVHDLVVATTGQIRDERNATGVVLELRPVKARARAPKAGGGQQLLLSSWCTPREIRSRTTTASASKQA
jgi:hypothetical protein